MATVIFDLSPLREFFERLISAGNGDFEKEASLWLEALGIEFLRVVEDEIKRLEAVDTRMLLHSFTKGDENNIWEVSDGGLTLEVGTHAHYASYVNDGHPTFDPAKTKHFTLNNGEKARFVPGVWNGDKFQYTPGAKTGMILKLHFVDGKPYWDNALRIFEKMFPDLLEAKFQKWIDSYFDI